jgi:hypothetical protein
MRHASGLLYGSLELEPPPMFVIAVVTVRLLEMTALSKEAERDPYQ